VSPDRDDEGKRTLLGALVEKVVLRDDGPVVHFSFAVPPMPEMGNCKLRKGGRAPLRVS